MIKKLSIKGSNWETGADYMKETVVNDSIICKILPAIEAIIGTSKSSNWSWGTYLSKKSGDWVSMPKCYELYPEVSHDVLDAFSKYVPSGIDRITSIKILEYEVINEISYM